MKTSRDTSTADGLDWHWDASAGRGRPSHDPVRMRWHEHHLERAQRDDASAQFMVGFHFEKGYGVRKDYCEAYQWYAIANTNGYQPAAIAKDRITVFLSPEDMVEAEHVVRMWNLGGLQDGIK